MNICVHTKPSCRLAIPKFSAKSHRKITSAHTVSCTLRRPRNAYSLSLIHIFYPGARHELLVETNKQEVFADIAAWLDKQLAKQ